MNKYNNACSEVYIILQDLDETEYNKIPKEVIEIIKLNRNKDYNYELNNKLKLKEQPMLPETKAILFNLFRDYLATQEQKQKIIRIQKEERQKNELKKQQKYNIDLFKDKQREDNTKHDIIEENKEIKQIIKYKENIFIKILNKLKSFCKNWSRR